DRRRQRLRVALRLRVAPRTVIWVRLRVGRAAERAPWALRRLVAGVPRQRLRVLALAAAQPRKDQGDPKTKGASREHRTSAAVHPNPDPQRWQIVARPSLGTEAPTHISERRRLRAGGALASSGDRGCISAAAADEPSAFSRYRGTRRVTALLDPACARERLEQRLAARVEHRETLDLTLRGGQLGVWDVCLVDEDAVDR